MVGTFMCAALAVAIMLLAFADKVTSLLVYAWLRVRCRTQAQIHWARVFAWQIGGGHSHTLPWFQPPAEAGFCWITLYEAIFHDPEFVDEGYDSPTFPNKGSKWKRPVLADTVVQYFPTPRGGVMSYGGWIDKESLQYVCACAGWTRLSVGYYAEGAYHVSMYDPQNSIPVGSLPPGWYGVSPDLFADSSLRTAVLALSVGDYTKEMSFAHTMTPYAVPNNMVHYLRSAGLPDPAPYSLPHPHPIHRALANANLQVVTRLLNSVEWYGLWVRPEVIQYMQRSAGITEPTELFNPRYSAKDISRYANTPAPETFAPINSSPVWFAHDVLHHLSASTIGSWFDCNPHLRTLVATAVIPPETVFGLPALRPDLYNFERRGDMIMYIPEGDKGGHYVQPYAARDWLRTDRLITPNNECLHVNMIHQKYAHAVFVISRTELLKEKHRVMDMPDVTVIPRYCHPFGTLFDRMTSPSLLNSLTSYAVRVSATNMRDLYAKIASYQAEQYGRFPASYTRAAAIYALSTRVMDWHTTPRVWDYLWMRLAYLTMLPFTSFAWLTQSVTSRIFGTRHDVPNIWDVKLGHLVSHPTDSVLPGFSRPVCDSRSVPFFYVPPSASRASRLACWSAAVSIWLMLKLSFFIASQLFFHLLPYAPSVVRYVAYVLELDPVYTPIGLLLVFLSMWLRIRGPHVGFPPVIQRTWWALRRLYACLFFLPCAQLPFPAGLTTTYQLCLLTTIIVNLWPRLVPMYYSNPSPGLQRWIIAITVTVTSTSLGLSLLLKRGSELPHHCDNVGCKNPQTPNERSEFADVERDAPCNLPPLTPRDPVLPPYRYTPPQIVVTPPAGIPEAAIELMPVPRAAPEQAPVRVRYYANNPLSAYTARPSSFDSHVSYRRWLANLQAPTVNPDPNMMCVWNCLGTVLGCAPTRVFANYLSVLTVAEQAAYANGAVPYDDLHQVIGFFGISADVRLARAQDPACPRAPGVLPPPPIADPQLPSLYRHSGLPGWPSCTLYISSLNGGNFHMTLVAAQARGANPALPTSASIVGYLSRQVPRVEIQEVLNIPVRMWQQAYARLNGTLANAAAAAIPELQGVAPYRAPFVPLPAIPVRVHTLSYILNLPDANLARKLSQDMKCHPDRLELREANPTVLATSLDALAKSAVVQLERGTTTRAPVRLHLICGSAGTGKTHFLLQHLKDIEPLGGYNAANLRFHSWKDSLRSDLEQYMRPHFPFLQSFSFATGVMPFAQPLGGTLVLDDATQLWPGYIPLLIATNTCLTDIVITADTAQGRSVFPHSDAVTREDISTAEWLSRLSPYYATTVRRYSPEIASLFGLAAHEPEAGEYVPEGSLYIVSSAPADVPYIVVSPRFAETLLNGGKRCMTFADCQGKTIHGDVAIDLGGLTATATDNAVWTALTRARGNIFLVLGPNMGRGTQLVESVYGNSQILSAILAVSAQFQTAKLTVEQDPDRLIAKAVQSHLVRNISGPASHALGLAAPNPVIGQYVGAAQRAMWLDSKGREIYDLGEHYTARTERARFSKSKSSGAPAFSAHAKRHANNATDVAHHLRHYVAVHNGMSLQAPDSGYSLPPAPELVGFFDPVHNHLENLASEDREVAPAGSIQRTTQHIDDGPSAILHHTRADRATIILSEQKRIEVGEEPLSLSVSQVAQLRQLKTGFKKFFDVGAWNDSQFNSAEFEARQDAFLSPWVSKRTGAAIANSVAKDPLDGDLRFTRLFLKGQYVKKEEKRYSKATAGQIVSEFPLTKQFRDAPWAYYVEGQALKYARNSTYLHCRASPDDMSEWYRAQWCPGDMTSNDYTAWDNGCTAVFAAFICWVMEISKVPKEYRDTYYLDRLRTRSYLGPHFTRQESGDRWTWLANTLCNAALTGASLNCPVGTPCAFSGDDGVVLGRWRQPPGFHSDSWKMTPKREVGPQTEFCGYSFGGPDVVISARTICHRAQYGLALGRSDDDYWRSIENAIREAGARTAPTDTYMLAAEHYLKQARTLFAA